MCQGMSSVMFQQETLRRVAGIPELSLPSSSRTGEMAKQEVTALSALSRRFSLSMAPQAVNGPPQQGNLLYQAIEVSPAHPSVLLELLIGSALAYFCRLRRLIP